MSATILRFPRAPGDPGLTYVVTSSDGEGGKVWSWLLYRQPADAGEPGLVAEFLGFDEAVEVGRDLARRNHDRFVIDEGVL